MKKEMTKKIIIGLAITLCVVATYSFKKEVDRQKIEIMTMKAYEENGESKLAEIKSISDKANLDEKNYLLGEFNNIREKIMPSMSVIQGVLKEGAMQTRKLDLAREIIKIQDAAKLIEKVNRPKTNNVDNFTIYVEILNMCKSANDMTEYLILVVDNKNAVENAKKVVEETNKLTNSLASVAKIMEQKIE